LLAGSAGGLGCGTTPEKGPASPTGGAASGDVAKVGAAAPDFSAEPVAGDGPKTLKDASGKVVLVDFWATFCDPCKKSFPAYQKLVDQFGGELVVIAISVDEPDNATKEQLADFVKTTGVKFTVVWDKAGDIRGKKYEVPKMPTSYIVDKTGVVRHMHAGYEDGEDTKVAEEVKALLK
jgi:peroxiredoxin